MFFRLVENCFCLLLIVCVKVSSLLFIMEVKLENHEKKVKMKLENESVIKNLKLKLLVLESVVQEANRAPVRLAVVDSSTCLSPPPHHITPSTPPHHISPSISRFR